MTQIADDVLSTGAMDFYSFLKLKLHFQEEGAEAPEEAELKMQGFDLSTGDFDEYEIDFSQSEALLLSQAIAFGNQARQLTGNFRYRDALALLYRALDIRKKLNHD